MASDPTLFSTPCTYVEGYAGGYSRVRRGDGFSYVTARGRPVRAARTIARLDAIAMPPAYEGVWYCPSPRGHIQGLGTDARGRRQYRYHPAFRAEAEQDKFAALIAFGQRLPLIRRRVAEALARRDLSRDRVIAAVVRLLDVGHIRIGNSAYADANGSFGATTLRARHASVGRDRLRLDFVGKSGKAHSIAIADRRLASVVRGCREIPGQRLFQFLDADGQRHAVDSGDVNDWLRDCCGDFTAKTFRTWHASVIAFAAIAASDEVPTMVTVMKQVSDKLGNTPAIARKSYVHPALIDVLSNVIGWNPQWLAGRRATQWLSRAERGFIAMLEDVGAAPAGAGGAGAAQ